MPTPPRTSTAPLPYISGGVFINTEASLPGEHAIIGGDPSDALQPFAVWGALTITIRDFICAPPAPDESEDMAFPASDAVPTVTFTACYFDPDALMADDFELNARSCIAEVLAEDARVMSGHPAEGADLTALLLERAAKDAGHALWAVERNLLLATARRFAGALEQFRAATAGAVGHPAPRPKMPTNERDPLPF